MKRLANTAAGLVTEAQSEMTKIAQLEALQGQRVPDLDKSWALRSELVALQRPVSGPDWTGLAGCLFPV